MLRPNSALWQLVLSRIAGADKNAYFKRRTEKVLCRHSSSSFTTLKNVQPPLARRTWGTHRSLCFVEYTCGKGVVASEYQYPCNRPFQRRIHRFGEEDAQGCYCRNQACSCFGSSLPTGADAFRRGDASQTACSKFSSHSPSRWPAEHSCYFCTALCEQCSSPRKHHW